MLLQIRCGTSSDRPDKSTLSLDRKKTNLTLVHFGGEYEVLVVGCEWRDHIKASSNTCTDRRKQVNVEKKHKAE